MNLFWYKVFWRIFGNIVIYNGLRMQGLSWGVPVVTGDMSMGRGIVLAVLCIPLPLAGEALARVNCVLPHGVLCVPPVIS